MESSVDLKLIKNVKEKKVQFLYDLVSFDRY